jgi:hypothetical protein
MSVSVGVLVAVGDFREVVLHCLCFQALLGVVVEVQIVSYVKTRLANNSIELRAGSRATSSLLNGYGPLPRGYVVEFKGDVVLLDNSQPCRY